jgi:hypothetical protein
MSAYLTTELRQQLIEADYSGLQLGLPRTLPSPALALLVLPSPWQGEG